MIDSETLMTLGQARAWLGGRLPGGLTERTIRRWAASGRLETVKVGGRRYTSREALDRFLAAPDRRDAEPPKPRTRPRRRRPANDWNQILTF